MKKNFSLKQIFSTVALSALVGTGSLISVAASAQDNTSTPQEQCIWRDMLGAPLNQFNFKEIKKLPPEELNRAFSDAKFTATLTENLPCFKHTVQEGAVPNEQDLKNALMDSSPAIANAIIDMGVDVSGSLPLAAYYSTAKIVQKIIDRNSDVNEKDAEGNTPLINAVKRTIRAPNDRDDIKVVETLLAAGADIDAIDKKGRTALMIAKENLRGEEEKLSKYGESYIPYAIRDRHYDSAVASLLEAAPAHGKALSKPAVPSPKGPS